MFILNNILSKQTIITDSVQILMLTFFYNLKFLWKKTIYSFSHGYTENVNYFREMYTSDGKVTQYSDDWYQLEGWKYHLPFGNISYKRNCHFSYSKKDFRLRLDLSLLVSLIPYFFISRYSMYGERTYGDGSKKCYKSINLLKLVREK